MMTRKVHKQVFNKSFDERNLFTAQIAVVKIKGTTIYLPTRINNSDKNVSTLRHAGFSVGRIKAASIPNKTPNKYFAQTFISYNYNIIWKDILYYVIIKVCLVF